MSSEPGPRQTAEAPVDSAEPVPGREARRALLSYIERRVSCPLRILDVDGAGVQEELTLRWWQIARASYQVDDEVPYDRFHVGATAHDAVSYEYEDGPFASVMDAHADALNISTWYPRAREEFLGAVRLFQAPVVDAKARPKHYPPPGAKTQTDLARASIQTGQSVLAFGVTPHLIGLVARDIEVDHCDLLYGQDHSRAFVDCKCDVGFSEGRSTTWLAVEWTSSAVHGYPVSESEVEAKVTDATAEWVDQFGARHEYQAYKYSTGVLLGYPKLARG